MKLQDIFVVMAVSMFSSGADAEVVPIQEGSPLLGGYAVLYAGAFQGDTWVADGPAVNFVTDGSLFSGAASAAPNSGVTGKLRSQPWQNKAELSGTHGAGLQYGTIFSAQGINQVLRGPAGESAKLTYRFQLDGSFAPGPQERFALPEVQYMFAYLAAYRGQFEGFEVIEEGPTPDMRILSSNGSLSLMRGTNVPGYIDTLSDDLLVDSYFCMGPAPQCLGESGPFETTLEITFSIGVDDPFSLASSIFGKTNGSFDLFNTLKLDSILVPNGFSLEAEDGGLLRRLPDGSYGLPAVPEPRSWVLFIAGFGLAGAAVRQRSRAMERGLAA